VLPLLSVHHEELDYSSATVSACLMEWSVSQVAFILQGCTVDHEQFDNLGSIRRKMLSGAIMKWRLTDFVLDTCIDAHVQEKFNARIMAISGSHMKQRRLTLADLEMNIVTSRNAPQNVNVSTFGSGPRFVLFDRQVTTLCIGWMYKKQDVAEKKRKKTQM
jgi:hypothetical protein